MPDTKTTGQQIQSILKSIGSAYHNGTWEPESTGDRAWTQRILQEFGRLGHELGYYVCTKQGMYVEANYGEWLFDLCWLEYEGGLDPDTPLLSVPLAMECEWQKGISDIKHDFEKLLSTSADLKVLIFQQEKTSGAEKVHSQLVDWINRYQPGRQGTFLLCCYVGSDKEFHFTEI